MHRGGEPVAGLACAEDLLGVFHRHLNTPPPCVPVDDLGRAGCKVGGGQGQIVVGLRTVADEHDLDRGAGRKPRTTGTG